MSRGVGRRRGLDSELLWLWLRPVATAPIRSLAWEPPCATGAALEKDKKTEKKKKPKNPLMYILIKPYLSYSFPVIVFGP